MRMSQVQQVAIIRGRALRYHTPLPIVARNIVGNQSTVANSIPASGPPSCTHRLTRKWLYRYANSTPNTSDRTADFAIAGPMKAFICSGDMGVTKASIPLMKTLLHITQSTRYAITPAISPATIQFIRALPLQV